MWSFFAGQTLERVRPHILRLNFQLTSFSDELNLGTGPDKGQTLKGSDPQVNEIEYTMPMKLIIGLGNPGTEYARNRHNAGFMYIDFVAQTYHPEAQFSLDKKINSLTCEIDHEVLGRVLLLKPQAFMNNSGESVREAMNYYKIQADNIVVAHDDLDIHFGEYKIQKGTGPKVHNGINSIEQNIATQDFIRIRIGIDNRGESDFRIDGKSYVLDNFSMDESSQLHSTIFPSILKQFNEVYGQR